MKIIILFEEQRFLAGEKQFCKRWYIDMSSFGINPGKTPGNKRNIPDVTYFHFCQNASPPTPENTILGQRKPNAPVVGTPENGERSDQHQAVCMLLRFCGCCARPWQSRFTATAAFTLTLSGTLLVNVRPGRASFFPELVRFPPLACLSCRSPGRRPESQGADMGLMSLNGIKLVVTFLASPARI